MPSKIRYARGAALRGLCKIATRHDESRAGIVATLTATLAGVEGVEDEYIATSAMCAFVDLKAVEAAEVIERAFSRNCIDVAYMGDWDQVRQQLGVEGLGLTMPREPFDSLADMRTSIRGAVFGVDDEPFPETPSTPTPVLEQRSTVGRNDPFPCGSGKKYKKCCR